MIRSILGLIGKQAAILTILTYQALLAPYMGGNCRFHPSCSRYALESFQTEGFAKGLRLTLARLAQCHPWGKLEGK